LRAHVAPAREWREYLLESLADPREAVEYLNAALEDGDAAVFLSALRNVAESRGIGNLASHSKLNREHTYRILSVRGNPQLKSLSALLNALDLRLAVEPKPQCKRRVVHNSRKVSLEKLLEAKRIL
jgi:probable addiction module antidote protein